ncbi:MAG: hypothetical protein HOM58_10925 [Rhodospirillaceae bacterium]|jgi:hypothetical protein|nr:hypothetical protein [Acidiferrobacteraceae bacterium]MBT5049004.1 hypothetical protein [Rhodospirillaceae bacterium]MBT5778854.1 hypothetical protein [Rhodospirillaceae bacterium]MBT7293643.1 hypothetical protein [Rhodospirillaceae bacterium]
MAKTNAKGRSKGVPRHVRLEHSTMDTPAYRSLSPNARSVLMEVMKRYNGFNNGDVGLGCREAGEAIGRSPNTAALAFKELQAKGFIKPREIGHFNIKNRLATTWTLACKAPVLCATS